MSTSRASPSALKENVPGKHSAESPTSKRPGTPNLALDINKAGAKPTEVAHEAARSPTNTTSPLSPERGPSFTTAAASPDSPRSRNRGYSLRRSLFTRSIHGQAGGSVIQLAAVASSSHSEASSNFERPASNVKGSGAMTGFVSEDDHVSELPRRMIKKAHGISALPHYETWVKTRAARTGFIGDLKAMYGKVRKTILRINETPPSKDGRHIDLDPKRKRALIDERTGRQHIGNTIRSSRYTLWNFFPRQLFAQFSKLANFYFLCVSVLQMMPSLSTTGSYTTIIPLLFFVSISIAKEGYDDVRRYRLDKVENNSDAVVLHAYKPTSESFEEAKQVEVSTSGPKHWAKTKWKDVQVGDVIKLSRDQAAPADLAILHADGRNGVAYFETMALDGETNLKSKQASSPLAKSCRDLNDLASCGGHFVVEDPNLDLYSFEGKVTVGGETQPLTNTEIVYRGSILRNTAEAFGMVIYTGEECKIRMNATKNPRIKAPALQAVVNKVVVIIVIFVIALAIFHTAAYQFWAESSEEKSWYLTNAGVSFFPILASFIIMYNTMIPLSLYVSLEIVKLFQMILMNDIDMYDEESDTPMEARTSTINEELGQVSYIFSDKTGTLTNNSMRFRKMSVAGTAWLHDLDLQQEAIQKGEQKLQYKNDSKGKKPANRLDNVSELDWNLSRADASATRDYRSLSNSGVARSSSVKSHWKSSARPNKTQPELRTADLIQYIQKRPHTLFARKSRFFLLSLALCHTCLPELKTNGDIDYQAASPDELALVHAAQELGYMMVDRQAGTITIKTWPKGSEGEPVFEVYEILNVIEFSSNRKRMSIVVRMPNRLICIFCKGADSSLMQRLRLSGLAINKATEIERRASRRKSIEAQQVIRRNSEQHCRKNSSNRTSLSVGRPSMGGIGRASMTASRLQPIRDELDSWLRNRERDVDMSSLDDDSIYYPTRSSAQFGVGRSLNYSAGRPSFQTDAADELVEEAMVVDDAAVFERCFQHINDFATEGLRTLLYGYRYLNEQEYTTWKKVYLDATTSLVDRQEMIEKAGELVEKDFELAGATAIEDKLQKGVPEAIDKLRRANIKLWMLTGDKRETAINIGHSCRLIKDYSSITILDHEVGEVDQRIAAAIIDLSRNSVAHSVVVIDGQTLALIEAEETVKNLFIDLAVIVDSVICCRASPSQKASLVKAIRKKVKKSITLAIGDGANDIAMIQEAHVGVGITGKEGLQAARTSDYSIAQFRFLLKLLLVHGRWNYIRTCKYTLGTFWKEMLFYLTQALYQRSAGYTGTSLYEPWSLSMFNTLFTSLPVIFMGIFQKDLAASTLLAVPELYTIGQRNGGFNIKIYFTWVFTACSEAIVIFFIMLGLYGNILFTKDNGLHAMGALTFTACIIFISTKMQLLEMHNKTFTCAIAIFLSVGGWFLWNIVLSAVYKNNVIYNVKSGMLHRFGHNMLWWLTLGLIVASCVVFEVAIRSLRTAWLPTDVDVFQELEQDRVIRGRFEEAAASELQQGWNGEMKKSSFEFAREAAEAAREGEIQDLLDRPRVMEEGRLETQVLRRKHSFAEQDEGTIPPTDHDGADGVATRNSADIQELLKRGFGSVRNSHDLLR
ncbi:MAG: hypothetical protein M1830_001602 [Pleopsidium flavum]|nr:MAG: hypothetical protein M1830_001602 [Pleopsidium flavum]